MKILEERILRDGKVKPGNVLKVGGFLNHLIDQQLLDEIGKEISALFCGQNITKILTIEASGIAIACAAAHYVHHRKVERVSCLPQRLQGICLHRWKQMH